MTKTNAKGSKVAKVAKVEAVTVPATVPAEKVKATPDELAQKEIAVRARDSKEGGHTVKAAKNKGMEIALATLAIGAKIADVLAWMISPASVGAEMNADISKAANSQRGIQGREAHYFTLKAWQTIGYREGVPRHPVANVVASYIEGFALGGIEGVTLADFEAAAKRAGRPLI